MPEDVLMPVVVIYGIGTVIILALGIVRYVDARDGFNRMWGARMVFGAWLWPGVAAYLTARHLRAMWRAADWKGAKR